MPDVPAPGSHVRIWLKSGRRIDCKIGTDVGEGKVTILPDGRRDVDWERITWAQVWSVRELKDEG